MKSPDPTGWDLYAARERDCRYDPETGTYRMTAMQLRRAFDTQALTFDRINETAVEPDARDLFLRLLAAQPAWDDGRRLFR